MSKKKTFYKQCRYETAFPEETGELRFDVAWIPENLAKVGQLIYFGEKREPERIELWRVTLAGDNRRDGSRLKERERDHLKHRKATDI